jgi:hypothetical protein
LRRAGARKCEPALRQQIIIDGHAPDEYRALTARNLDARYQARPHLAKPARALCRTA